MMRASEAMNAIPSSSFIPTYPFTHPADLAGEDPVDARPAYPQPLGIPWLPSPLPSTQLHPQLQSMLGGLCRPPWP